MGVCGSLPTRTEETGNFKRRNEVRLYEAKEEASRINALGGVSAEPVRILPETVDPVREGDNGWDVEVTVE